MQKTVSMLVLALFLLTGFVGRAFATELKTVTLDVDGMVCNVCPVTVKKSLQKVDGVTEAKAVYEGNGNGWATVTYDADKTNVEALTQATEKAGYPSSPMMPSASSK